MDRSRLCGCKGCRTCLICEEVYGLFSKFSALNCEESYVYCPHCNLAWPGRVQESYKSHPNHEGSSIELEGVFIDLNFLSEEEESFLMKNIDSLPWDLSQSGRRKQNFGPKCNFKKRKLKLGNFQGFPEFSKFVQEKFNAVPLLKNFHTIEQCSLEYNPERGASIDPHIDDCWIWGERIVTVNLLSDSVLTMTYFGMKDKYNLSCVSEYPKVIKDSAFIDPTESEPFIITPLKEDKWYPIIRIPMPRRSLLVLYGSARYDWEHQVLRNDVTERRVCLAYREFTPPYLPGGKYFIESKDILIKAKEFWDPTVKY